LRESVKDYSDIITENQIKDILSGLLKESKDPELMKVITRLIRTLFVGVINRPIEFFRIANLSNETYLLEQHQNTSVLVSDLLEKTSMAFENYVDLLDRLFIDNLIQTVSSIFWCESCGDEKSRYFELHGQSKPSQMTRWKCPNCGKLGVSSSVFALDSLLLECIYGQDGFLGLYLAWRLADEGISFESGITIDGHECDFIANDTLIECKMFQMPGRESTNLENLESVIANLKRKVEAISSDDRRIKSAILLWNQAEGDDLVEQVSVKYNEFMEKYQFAFFTFDEITDLLEFLKS
jgi:DNA-directed RNA polymerase subunit M/transcription elongation factor TFIIS